MCADFGLQGVGCGLRDEVCGPGVCGVVCGMLDAGCVMRYVGFGVGGVGCGVRVAV